MEKQIAISVLEALSSGCSPSTGELLRGHKVLKEDLVQQVFQEAILALRVLNNNQRYDSVELEENHLEETMEFFYKKDRNPTPHRLAQFFRGSRALKPEALQDHQFFGSLYPGYRYTQIKTYLEVWFEKNPDLAQKYFVNEEAWKQVVYFQSKSFNNLTVEERDILKNAIKAIPIVRQENLTPELKEIRERFPRSHEPWSDEEKELLAGAISKTNDLQFLSDCFQRGRNAIEISGQKLIFYAEPGSLIAA